MISKKFASLNEKEFKLIKSLTKAGLSISQIKTLTDRGVFLIVKVNQCETLADYKKLTAERNKVYRANIKAKKVENKVVEDLSVETEKENIVRNDNAEIITCLKEITEVIKEIVLAEKRIEAFFENSAKENSIPKTDGTSLPRQSFWR